MRQFERVEIQDPDGGTHYVDRYPHSLFPRDRSWHLVGCGRNFTTPGAARRWLHEHWNDPSPPDSFGEVA